MVTNKFTSELIAPCGMNCALCRGYIAYTHGIPRVRGKITTAQAAFPEAKTVSSKENAANSQNMKSNSATSAMRCPARTYIA